MAAVEVILKKKNSNSTWSAKRSESNVKTLGTFLSPVVTKLLSQLFMRVVTSAMVSLPVSDECLCVCGWDQFPKPLALHRPPDISPISYKKHDSVGGPKEVRQIPELRLNRYVQGKG